MTTLSSLCDLIVDCEHRTAPTTDAGYPLIRTPDVGVGRIDHEGALRVDEETYRAWTRRAVPQAGDLILAREAPVGNVGIVRPGVQPVLGQRTVLIRPRSDVVDPCYLNYLMSGPELRGWMEGVSTGATVPHLNMADIRSMEMPPLPLISAQRKIGAVLTAYDELIENNNRRIKLLDEMSGRIYREWFVDFRYPGHKNVGLVASELGLIPDGWTVNRLGDALEFVYGRALKADARRDGAVTVFGSGGAIGHHDQAIAEGPGIIVGRKGNVGAVYWSDGAFFPIDTTYWVRADLPLTYCFYALREMDFLDSHAAVPGLSREQAYSLPILVPDAKTVAMFDVVALNFFALQRRLNDATDRLQLARDLLLPRLVSGAVDVTALGIAMQDSAA